MFHSGKIRTVAGGTAFQTALRSYSKEAEGTVSVYVILVKGVYISRAHIFFAEGFC